MPIVSALSGGERQVAVDVYASWESRGEGRLTTWAYYVGSDIPLWERNTELLDEMRARGFALSVWSPLILAPALSLASS